MSDAPDPIAQPDDETVVIEWGDGGRSGMTVERLIRWCEAMGNGGTDFSNLAMPKWRAVAKLLRDRNALVLALREARQIADDACAALQRVALENAERGTNLNVPVVRRRPWESHP